MNRPWFQHYPDSMAREIDASVYKNIGSMIGEACSQFSSKEAMICIDVSMTYSEYERRATQFAKYLQNELGLKKGDRLGIMLPNLFEFPIAFYAAQKLGVICVNTNPLYTPREMKHQFVDSGCRAIVILDIFMGNLAQIINETEIESVVTVSIGDNLPLWKKWLVNTVITLKGMKAKTSIQATHFPEALEIGDRHNNLTMPEITRDDVSVLQYTGGTTGVSKGAMLTHGNIIANIMQNKEWAKEHITESQETVLTALPMYHIFALSINFLSFVTQGQRMVLIPRPIPIHKTLGPLEKYKITVMTGVNTIFNEMINHPKFENIDFSNLKCVFAGGMALQPSVAKEWERVTNSSAIEGYGLTEASPTTHCNPLDGNHRLGSIGIPLPSTDAKIVNPEGVEVASGEVGELIISGPQVMKGYWQRPDETAKTLKDGWLWTGDLAQMTDDGFFAIVDRKKDMILVSGFNVFPNEVEKVITDHPKVLEASVIGVKDTKSGERVKAYVVAKDRTLTIDELKTYCKDQLAGYKCPKAYEFRDDLPKSNVGKVLRRALRDEDRAS